MRMMIGVMAMALTTQPALAQETGRFERAVAAVEARIAETDKLGTYPGRALVMVKVGEAPVIDVVGRTRAEGGEAATGETPFYIASMTKAFVGLMAVRLDEMGVLSLDTTIGEIFPEMTVEGVDFDGLTMRDALSHQLGFRAVPLNIRTAYTDLVAVDEYPAIVNASGEANGEAFRYDNLGYLLYGAALEKKTGRSWRSWIDDIVFDPLGMTHTSARTSDFREVSHLHEEYEDGWRTYAPKSDAVMHAAGGLHVSANDMARWLAANAGAPSAIPREIFGAAQAAQVPLDMAQGPMKCTGYAFGWRRCEALGFDFLEHGGGYTGMRSEMIVLPEEGVGFAVVFNSDSMTGGLSGKLMQTFLMSYAGADGELPDPAAFVADYAQDTKDYRANRSQRERDALAALGGGWTPSSAELIAISGTYRHAAAGTIELVVAGDRLAGEINGTAIMLRPSEKDRFLASMTTDPTLEDFAVVRDARGAVTGLTYSDVPFARVD